MTMEDAYEELEAFFGSKNRAVRKKLLGDAFEPTCEWCDEDESTETSDDSDLVSFVDELDDFTEEDTE